MPVLYRKSLKDTGFGDVNLVWSEFGGKPQLVRIFLSGTREWIPPGSMPGSCDMVLRVSRGIEALLAGQTPDEQIQDGIVDYRQLCLYLVREYLVLHSMHH